MDKTSLTLLSKLQQTNQPESWQRLIAIYRPLLLTWLNKYAIQDSDAEDLAQEVLIAVMKDIESFDHNGRPGAFRTWLRSILVNRLRNFWRAHARQPLPGDGSDRDRQIAELEDPTSQLSRLWNQQHDQHVTRQILAIAKPHFSPDTWTAFTRVALEGEKADAVAADLGISVNAVFIAKSRVLSRLRREAEGLIEAASSF